MTAFPASLQSADWLQTEEMKALFAALGAGARVVGGAVRDGILNKPVMGEIDIATALKPQEVMRRLKEKGIRVLPTGLEHGTITALMGGKSFEITTLRVDVKTDGRHAEVAFTEDWQADAQRRDLTINALYADPDGTIHDPLNGRADLEKGIVRFIGDPRARIQEDYLRILRFFRCGAFFAEAPLDEKSLQACFALKDGIKTLSRERVQSEILKLLAAPRAPQIIAQMEKGGLWSAILPDGKNIAAHASLHKKESDNFLPHDALLGFASFFESAQTAEKSAQSLKMSNAQIKRAAGAHEEKHNMKSYLSLREVRRFLYLWGREVFSDRVFLAWAADPKEANVVRWRALLAMAQSWQKPPFPLTGDMVKRAGISDGREIGRILKEVEEWWIDADFPDDGFSVIERLKAVAEAAR